MPSMSIGRRSLLRGLGAGTVLLSGMTRTLLAEAAVGNPAWCQGPLPGL
jgi:hypothetical protein